MDHLGNLCTPDLFLTKLPCTGEDASPPPGDITRRLCVLQTQVKVQGHGESYIAASQTTLLHNSHSGFKPSWSFAIGHKSQQGQLPATLHRPVCLLSSLSSYPNPATILSEKFNYVIDYFLLDQTLGAHLLHFSSPIRVSP